MNRRTRDLLEKAAHALDDGSIGGSSLGLIREIDEHLNATDPDMDRARAMLDDCALETPIVYAALQSIYHGATVEEALATAVKCLAEFNKRIMADVVMIAASRPLFIEKDGL